MLSISTAWNYHPGKPLRQMILEIKDLGLDSIELGYTITLENLRELISLLEEMKVKVLSVHNFCPLPYDHPSPRHPSNYYRLSALDEQERLLSVNWTKRTLDTALVVKAEVVVIHAGTIELTKDTSGILFNLFRQGKHHSEEFKKIRQDLLNSRYQNRAPFLLALQKSLKEILDYANKKKVKIGLETRYYPLEIPNVEEIGELLKLFGDQGLYYWHDVGHAQVNDYLGITPHLKYLNQYGPKAIGFHLHGIKGLRDHQAPFRGDFDLQTILPFINGNHIKVIESHRHATKEEIKEAVLRLS